MNATQNVADEQDTLNDILSRFAMTHVEDILQPPYVKLALNKLRYVLVDFGVSHYRLPEMPLLHYIQMAESIAELITRDSELDLTAFYRILAARNILILLKKAYDFNEDVQAFYNLTIEQILDPVTRVEMSMWHINLKSIFKQLSLSETDSVKNLAFTIYRYIDAVTEFWDKRESFCDVLTGCDNEKLILHAYELYRAFFSLYFAKRLPTICSEEHLCKLYHTDKFWIDYESNFILSIYSCEGEKK